MVSRNATGSLVNGDPRLLRRRTELVVWEKRFEIPPYRSPTTLESEPNEQPECMLVGPAYQRHEATAHPEKHAIDGGKRTEITPSEGEEHFEVESNLSDDRKG